MAIYINKDELINRLGTGVIPFEGKTINIYKIKNLELDDLTTRRVMACVMLIVNSMDNECISLYPRKARAEKIRGLRLDRKMSLTQLSKKSGISLRHLHKIEKGECQPFEQTLAKIADALGVKVEILL